MKLQPINKEKFTTKEKLEVPLLQPYPKQVLIQQFLPVTALLTIMAGTTVTIATTATAATTPTTMNKCFQVATIDLLRP